MSQRLTLLDWDSAHFGLRIARARTSQLDDLAAECLLEICREQEIDCLTCLVDCADQETITAVQARGFELVDIRLTLDAPCAPSPSHAHSEGIRFRLSQPGDLERLLPIAATSYQKSRFFVDRRFSPVQAARMYESWLRKSLTSDYAAAVVVAELHGNPIGYVTCHLSDSQGEGSIGLVGVAEAARGLGLARGMVAFALAWFHQQGAVRCLVVTQGRNIAAQRLYQRCGFATRSLELWFHKWFAAEPFHHDGTEE